jgi:hypothetical protein
MFIPIWFLITIVVLGTLRLFARAYMNRRISRITAEKIVKHIDDFDMKFNLLGKKGRFYTDSEKNAILEYPINEDSSNS